MIEESLAKLLIKNGKTLSLAESMTGGFVAHAITKNPGASKYFLGGVVSYSNESKSRFLGVDPLIISNDGAVSEKVAIAMANGALQGFNSDFALSITGVAGPSGGSEKKPVGFAWCALAIKGKNTYSWTFQAKARDREAIIREATTFLLKKLEAEAED